MDQEKLIEKIRERGQESRDINNNSNSILLKLPNWITNKYLYIVPSGILLAISLRDLIYFFEVVADKNVIFHSLFVVP